MKTKEINPVLAVVAVVLLVAAIGGLFYAMTRPKTPLRAGVDYTPGMPPWQDPKFKGDKTGRGLPGGASATAAAPASAAAPR